MAIVDGYATLPEVKAALRSTTTVDDARVERAIEAASRLVDHVTRRKFVPSSGVRVFNGWGVTVWVDDAQTVTLAEQSADQTTWSTVAATSYVSNARPPIRSLIRIDGGEWPRFVRVTGTWGEATVPPEVQQATVIQAVRIYKRPDTWNGILEGDFGAVRLARIDPDFLSLIRPLARPVLG